MMKRRRRPKRSLSPPERRISPASVSRYPTDTHCSPAIVAWKSLPIAGCAMPTTLPSSCAIALPSTVAVRTQRPRPVERRRPSAPLMAAATGCGAGSVTPRDVAEVAGGFGMAAVCGDPSPAFGDRGDSAVSRHHDRVLGERKQLRGDALDERLEVALRGSL